MRGPARHARTRAAREKRVAREIPCGTRDSARRSIARVPRGAAGANGTSPRASPRLFRCVVRQAVARGARTSAERETCAAQHGAGETRCGSLGVAPTFSPAFGRVARQVVARGAKTCAAEPGGCPERHAGTNGLLPARVFVSVPVCRPASRRARCETCAGGEDLRSVASGGCQVAPAAANGLLPRAFSSASRCVARQVVARGAKTCAGCEKHARRRRVGVRRGLLVLMERSRARFRQPPGVSLGKSSCVARKRARGSVGSVPGEACWCQRIAPARVFMTLPVSHGKFIAWHP